MQKIYQFKISLKDSKPPIWRRIQVPETYSFWDLHSAIQDAMGWYDYHLHGFEMLIYKVNEKRIGLPSADFADPDILPSWQEKIKDWFSLEDNKAMNYTYDYGDNWEHRVELEKILDREPNEEYPKCIAGRRDCPPEDSGGIWNYNESIAEEDLKYEEFDCEDVEFEDPISRLEDNEFLLDYYKIKSIKEIWNGK